MSRVVVVGGGFGGMASAARLAKLGHEVTLLETSTSLGGALGVVEQEGFVWDAAATSLTMPAVVRDLFRKSGRPVEDELVPGLEPLDVVREHRFVDRTSIALPGGSRAAQEAAFEELGKGLGAAWAAWMEPYAEVWDVLRRTYAEEPWDPAAPPPELAELFGSREMLYKRLRKRLRDDRVMSVAAHPLVMDGHDLRNVPAWMGVTGYLEQLFGAWHVPGGMHRLGAALAERLRLREVTVLLGNPALDVVVREGRAVAVSTELGEIDADVVVVAVDPRRLPTLARLVVRTMPALPPVTCYVGLEGELPDLPHEVVLHGDPLLVVRTTGTAPDGGAAWTLHGRGKLAEDVLRALARHKIDIRENVVTRVDRTTRELVEGWHGSPMGVLWQGRGTVSQRLGPTTPIPGVYAAGAHAAPGSGLPFVGLSAALVAQLVGPA